MRARWADFRLGLTALSLLAIGLIWPAPAASIPASRAEVVSSDTGSSTEPQVLTYAEAEQFGLDVSIPQGYRLCEFSPNWPGYDSPEEAQAASRTADEKRECAADPRFAEYVVGAPAATPDHDTAPYHHNGWETAYFDYEGGKGEFSVRDVSGISHNSLSNYDKFVVGRILVEKAVPPPAGCPDNVLSRWAEAGWSEVSWSAFDQRRVYTYGTSDCAWRFYDAQYNIQDGNFYMWRVQEQNDNLNTSILWDGQWQLLHSYGLDCSPTACAPEAFVEIYSAVTGEHPSWGSGQLNARNLQLRRSGGFFDWDTSVDTVVLSVNPYVLCTGSQYTSFHVLSSGSC